MTDIVERIKDAENATHAIFNYIFQDAREEIERLRIENEALRAEVIHIKEVEFPRKAQAVADGWRGKCERLEAKIAEMEKQEPIGEIVAFGESLHEVSWIKGKLPPLGAKLYAIPGAQNVPKTVAYLDLGTGGYMDIGTDLTDEALAALPKGKHMLGIVGTYGVDGYVPAQPAPSELLVTPKMEQAFYEKVEITTIGSIRGLADGIKAAMFAAATEAKP